MKSFPPKLPRHTHKFRAMGTDIAFWLESADSPAARNALHEAESLFHNHESVLSRFQSQSELSRLNRRSGRWTAVSKLLWDVLAEALAMSEMTGGRFDPTILNGLERAGYSHSFELLPLVVPVTKPSSYPIFEGSWQDILRDPPGQAVFLPLGLQLDFGGIAKGFTAQKCGELLGRLGPCLVDAGGDITAGAAPSGSGGWPIAVSSPRHAGPSADLFTLFLADAGLATSGIDHRRWQQNGRWQHHLIDPQTGRPAATDLLTATILAKTAAAAEAWATAAMIQDAESGTATLVANDIAAALITKNLKLIVTPAMAQYADLIDVLSRNIM